MQNVSVSRPAISLVPASVQGNLRPPAVARQLRQGAPVAADLVAASGGERSFEACVAPRRAKKKGAKKRRGDGEARGSKNKVKGGVSL